MQYNKLLFIICTEVYIVVGYRQKESLKDGNLDENKGIAKLP